MTRRTIFGFLAAACAGAAFDPERLLWVPGRKLISIPARLVVKPGDILTFGADKARYRVVGGCMVERSDGRMYTPAVLTLFPMLTRLAPGVIVLLMPVGLRGSEP